MRLLRDRQTPVVLTLVALGVWLLTVPTHSQLAPMSGEVDAYVRELPPGYWAAVALLLAGVATRVLFGRRDESVSFAADLLLMAVFALVFFGTVSVLEGTPRFFDAYGHYSVAVHIDNINDVNFPSGRDAYVGEIPGAFLFLAVLRQVGGVPDLEFVLWYPVVSRLVIAIGIYGIARTIGLRSGAIAAPLIFLSACWFEELHVSPQSVGLVYYVFALQCLISLWLHPPATRAARWRLLVMGFAGAAVFSHPGSPIFIGFTLAMFTAAVLLTSQRSRFSLPLLRVEGQRPTHYLGLFLLGTVAYFGYQLEFAHNGFGNISANLRDAIEGLLRGSGPVLEKVGEAAAQPAYQEVNNLREVGFIAVFLLALLAGVYIVLRGNSDQKSKAIALAAATAGCLLFVAVPSLVGGQYVERAALFSIMPLSLLGAFSCGLLTPGVFASVMRVGVLAVVLGTALLLPWTRSAGDPGEWPSKQELEASRFAVHNAANRGPLLARVANNTRVFDFYLQHDGLTGARFETTSPRISSRWLLLASPTGRGFRAIRDQKEGDYDAFVSRMDEVTNRVFDGGDGVVVYYARP